eukprot:411604-Pelagomonas_calceolata.AAC.3
MQHRPYPCKPCNMQHSQSVKVKVHAHQRTHHPSSVAYSMATSRVQLPLVSQRGTWRGHHQQSSQYGMSLFHPKGLSEAPSKCFFMLLAG